MTISLPPVSTAPLKCVPLPDEWPETLLGRLARRMGIRRPWKNDLDLLRPLLPASLRGLSWGEVRYGQDPMPQWALVGPRAQIYYCPACLTESRHIRGRWRLAQLTACTLHGLNLKSGLAEPAITAAYKSPGKRLIEEISHDDAWEGSSCPTPRAKDHLARVWAPFETRVLAGDAEAEIAEALAWALLAERLVDAATRAIRGPDYPPDGVLAHEHRALWLERYGLSIAPSFSGVSLFLKSLALPAHRRGVAKALSHLIHDEHRRKTLMARLPLQALHDVILAADVGAPARACGALPRALHPADHTSFDAAEVQIGCEPGLLHHLIQHRLINGVQRIRHGRKTYVFIPNDEVRRYRRFFSSCVTYDEMLEALAIDRSGYMCLRAAGLLVPLVIGRWRRYTKASISALLLKLETVSRPISASCELLPITGDWLRKGRRPMQEIADLLGEVFAGRLSVYRDLNASGLGAFFVDHKALVRLNQLSDCSRASMARRRWGANQMELWANS
jgi:hypothetical protein